jgi:aquaporin Z
MAVISDASKFLVELLGTFFFVSVILNTLTLTDSTTGPISVAVALLAAIYFGGKISGGHFNPAVSLSMYFKKVISLNIFMGYVIFQIIGAILAVILNNYLYP